MRKLTQEVFETLSKLDKDDIKKIKKTAISSIKTDIVAAIEIAIVLDDRALLEGVISASGLKKKQLQKMLDSNEILYFAAKHSASKCLTTFSRLDFSFVPMKEKEAGRRAAKVGKLPLEAFFEDGGDELLSGENADKALASFKTILNAGSYLSFNGKNSLTELSRQFTKYIALDGFESVLYNAAYRFSNENSDNYIGKEKELRDDQEKSAFRFIISLFKQACPPITLDASILGYAYLENRPNKQLQMDVIEIASNFIDGGMPRILVEAKKIVNESVKKNQKTTELLKRKVEEIDQAIADRVSDDYKGDGKS